MLKYKFFNSEFILDWENDRVKLREFMYGSEGYNSGMTFQNMAKAKSYVFDVCFEDASTHLEDLGLADDDYEVAWTMLKYAREEFRKISRLCLDHDMNVDLENLKSAIGAR